MSEPPKRPARRLRDIIGAALVFLLVGLPPLAGGVAMAVLSAVRAVEAFGAGDHSEMWEGIYFAWVFGVAAIFWGACLRLAYALVNGD